MADKKIKVLVLSDHPLSPSGVGTQTKYMIEGLLETGKFSFICLGGAIRHNDYSPVQVEGWEEDWIIYPVDGYGTQDAIRSLMRTSRPDMVWMMTDPRFWTWLWEIEHEIRPLAPLVYYHVWDNYPYPTFNKLHYESCDHIATISKVTDDIVKTVAPSVDSTYLPHGVDDQVFTKLDEKTIKDFRKEHLGEANADKFMFFWNNRNARRKQSGSLIFWFKEFLDKVGHDKACLLMHTDTKDPNGQDLVAIIDELGLTNQQVLFSGSKVGSHVLSMMYNMSDCTINISDAEGFGLATLESLSCGTPVIVTMTGGLQEQVTDGENYFGIGLEPSSKAVIGSQLVPFIYEDRLNGQDVAEAMLKMYNMSSEERNKLGTAGRAHVTKNYNFQDYKKKWADLMLNIHEQYGSWENRKNYKSWELSEV